MPYVRLIPLRMGTFVNVLHSLVNAEVSAWQNSVGRTALEFNIANAINCIMKC